MLKWEGSIRWVAEFGWTNLHVPLICCCIIDHPKPSGLRQRPLLFSHESVVRSCLVGQLVSTPHSVSWSAKIIWRLFSLTFGSWCWLSARTLVGSVTGTGTCGLPCGCLASSWPGGWVLQVSIPGGRDRRKLYQLLWLSLQSLQPHFCHILFIRSESRGQAHIQREGTNSTFWWRHVKGFVNMV